MRFLCLHGMGTNAQIFEAQLAQIRSQLVGQHEFVFVDGEVECEPAPGKFCTYSPSTLIDLPTSSIHRVEVCVMLSKPMLRWRRRRH